MESDPHAHSADPLWSPLDRRELLVKTAAALGIAGLVSPLEALGATHGQAGIEANPGKVRMLGWQGYDDKKGRAPFEKAGGKLQVTYIGNNDEILTKLRGGALGTYDVVTPSAGFLPALVQADLLQPLDYTKLPNSKGYFPFFNKPKWNTFGGHTWGAPIQWGDAPMVYRTDLVPNPPNSWFRLADPKYKGLVAMWDDGFGHIVVMAHALKFSPPNRLTEAQLKRATDELIKIRKNSRVVAPSLGDLADILARGDAAITTESWEGVAMFVRQKGKPASWKSPKEGSWGWNDQYAIPKKAPNPEGAYAFINTMISATSNASISNTTISGTPVKDAVKHLNPTAKKLFNYGQVGTALRTLGFYPLPPLKREGKIMSYPDWNDAWAKVKG
jgi:spermidine/putrescine transport system substrate-binding protein